MQKNNALQYYSAKRGEMCSFLPSKCQRILEVGCGVGNFSSHLKADGVEVWGIEPNPSAAEEAAQRLDKVFVGTYSEVEQLLPENYFDLVICNDVIEHMPDHDFFLERIKLRMQPHGYLVGSIPNVLHITSFVKIFVLRDWPYKEEGILDRTHLRFFTSKSLKKTLIAHHYQIERLHGINSIIANGTVLRNKSKIMDMLVRLGNIFFIIATMGYYLDSQYPQLGFKARVGSN